jgi:hypothetical protein
MPIKIDDETVDAAVAQYRRQLPSEYALDASVRPTVVLKLTHKSGLQIQATCTTYETPGDLKAAIGHLALQMTRVLVANKTDHEPIPALHGLGEGH